MEKTSELTKHIDIAYHFVRECCDDGKIVLKHVSGDKNPAHLLASKAIKKPEEFIALRNMLLTKVNLE